MNETAQTSQIHRENTATPGPPLFWLRKHLGSLIAEYEGHLSRAKDFRARAQALDQEQGRSAKTQTLIEVMKDREREHQGFILALQTILLDAELYGKEG